MLRALMHGSEQPTESRLRQLRLRAGYSLADLAKLAGVARNTLVSAERTASKADESTRRSISSGLMVALQRAAYARLADAHANVTRAQVELEGAQKRLERFEQLRDEEAARVDLEITSLSTELDELWPELEDEGEDEPAPALAA